MSDARPALRTVSEHRRVVLDLVPRPASVEIPVAEAHGLVLAGDVVARGDLPGDDNSAMDGYAVRAAELTGATPQAPVVLPVAGDIAAGDTTSYDLQPGTTMRIMTGAPMPAGADAVVPVEDSDGGVQVVALTLEPAPGHHIRRRGEDIAAGETVLRAGTMLDPGRLALAAAANVPILRAHRRARVAVVSTGDELVPPGSELARGQVVESNGIMLRALVEAAGAECVSLTHLPDEADAVGRYFTELPGDPDVVLTSGGVSMGAYDMVKEVLTRAGGVQFVKVAMRPGMPQGAGVLDGGRTAVVTLPGNPLSSLVSFHVFVLPLLRHLAGRDPDQDGRFTVTAGTDWTSVLAKTEFTRVVVADGVATPSGGQGSHMVGALGLATGLALVPPEVAQVQAGDVLTCLPLLGQELVRG